MKRTIECLFVPVVIALFSVSAHAKTSNLNMKRLFVIGCFFIAGIFLVSCGMKRTAGTESEDSGIESVHWYMTEVGGSPISPFAKDKQPHIILDPSQKQATGFSGCNNFFGSYELNGLSLKFSLLGATRMACPDLETGLETEVFNALEKTREWKLQYGDLLFHNENHILARFSKVPAPGIQGRTWQWMQTLHNDDRKTAPTEPVNYTVQFFDNGTLSIKADCNQKSGTYSVSAEEKTLTIDITHSTMAACPEGSLENEFVRELSAAAIYFFKDGNLYIDLRYDTGTMRLSELKRE